MLLGIIFSLYCKYIAAVLVLWYNSLTDGGGMFVIYFTGADLYWFFAIPLLYCKGRRES